MFSLTHAKLDIEALRASVARPDCGACVSFEGWVRNHNEGRSVLRLEYEAYPALALKEGSRILSMAQELFRVEAVRCVHRLGALEIGEAAVWVGAASPHRREAFEACSYVIEEVKRTVPVWKREHYAEGEMEWVGCAGCSASHEDSWNLSK